MAPLITLLTDFGYQDNYVGVMKGVMAGICADAQFIDLSHSVSPQDIIGARFILLTAYAYFPPDSVHLIVVDPGVGTTRRAIALQTAHGYFVAPDNGILSGVLEQEPVIAAIALTNSIYWRTAQPSATFHGRDIFAPIAAHLAQGIPLAQLGTQIDPTTLVQLSIAPPQVTPQELQGQIQYIDIFGNAVTTIAASFMGSDGEKLQVGDAAIPLHHTYGDVEPGQAIALIGSHGWLEIAVRGGSAQALFDLNVGDAISVRRQPKAGGLD